MFEGERALGPTFDPTTIGWLDFETACSLDLREVGAYRYATEARPIVLAYAIGDGPVRRVARNDFSRGLMWRDLPEEVHKHHFEVRQGRAKWAAWNAGFDKSIWNFSTDFQLMEAHHIIDVQCQAAASGMPPDLKYASYICADTKKRDTGRELIKLFCSPGAEGTPETHPKEWAEFLDYAGDDVGAMRDIFKRTRQLSMAEWQEYWAMERINERGCPIDMDMVRNAAKLADVDKVRSSQDLRDLTEGQVTTVDQVQRMIIWLRAQLGDVKELVKREPEIDDETGAEIRPARFSLTRKRVEKLLVYVRAQLIKAEANAGDATAYNADTLQDVERLLQIRLYGGSKTPAKFGKALAQQVDGVLFGQYTFNGAGQTGRASSRGVQVHNLARDFLPYEVEAINALLDGASYDEFARVGDSAPVSRKLSLLIRPAFVPDTGNVFVWSDWSQIEARVLPWLAGGDPGALARLQIFRDVDRDPKLPDLYTRTAATLSHCEIKAVTKPMRQRGKVAELALGFGGGVRALQAMAAGYGLYLEETECRVTVEGWRAANPWCVRFWGWHREESDRIDSVGLWGAINRAMKAPGTEQHAGRIMYTYVLGYLPGDYHGSLLCALPSGRVLTYRDLRSEMVDELDEDDNVVGQSRKLRFSRGLSRINFWHGLACENVVQATAADFLRGTLRRLNVSGHDVRLHTHDEILLQVRDDQREIAAKVHDLRHCMRAGFDWSEGLPLMSDEQVEGYYTKWEAK